LRPAARTAFTDINLVEETLTMSDAYIGEIRIFGFNFAPLDWAQCNGQTLGISQNTTLFQIIGTTYGGNGTSTFNLPNFQDLTAAGMGTGPGLRNWPLGGIFGETNHTLLVTEVPRHTHQATGAVVAIADLVPAPTATSYLGRTKGTAFAFSASPPNTTLAPTTISLTGGSQPHNNIQPVQVLNYCIALFGVFPPHAN
jgi:microcystin-dependent protein